MRPLAHSFLDVDGENDNEREEGEDAEEDDNVALKREVNNGVRSTALPDGVITSGGREGGREGGSE